MSCNNISHPDDPQPLLIKLVDENNDALKAQVAKWWFSDTPDKKMPLSCKEDACSEWVIKEKITSPITFYAHRSQVQTNDESCWDWFEGQIEINPSQIESTLTLSYSATVCK